MARKYEDISHEMTVADLLDAIGAVENKYGSICHLSLCDDGSWELTSCDLVVAGDSGNNAQDRIAQLFQFASTCMEEGDSNV